MRMLSRMTIAFALAVCCAHLMAESGTEDLRKEIDDLRRQLNNNGTPEATIQSVDTALNQSGYDGEHSGHVQERQT